MPRPLLLLLPLTLVPGCGEPGPGRFAHSAIQQTSAPWDGAATQLFLAEAPLQRPPRGGPYVLIQVYRPSSSLSRQRFVLDGTDKRLGGALWAAPDGSRQTLPWAAVSFDRLTAGAPVEGSYDVHLPDGSRARGRFRADWWPADGPGG